MSQPQTHFDSRLLHQAVRELGDYLAELRYIDGALAYIAQRHQIPTAGPGPRYDRIDITLGTTEPFTRQLGFHGRPPETVASEVNQYLSQIAGVASDWAAGNIDTLQRTIRRIVFPLTAGHDQIRDTLESGVAKPLNELAEDVGNLSNNLGDWSGQQAENFHDYFYRRFKEESLRHQRDFTAAVMAGLAAARANLSCSQTSVMNAVVAARDAAREQLTQRAQDTDQISAKEFLSVGSTVLGALGLVLGVGVPVLGIALGAASAAMGTATMVLPEQPETKQITGASAEQLELSLSESITDIVGYFDRSNEELHIELVKVKDEMDDLRKAHLLVPKRPELADGADPAEFHHQSSSRYTD